VSAIRHIEFLNRQMRISIIKQLNIRIKRFTNVSSFKLNFTSSIFSTLINIIIGLLGLPIYLHYLGYELYGAWLIISIVLSFVQFTNLGLGPAITKRVSEEYAKENIAIIEEYVVSACSAVMVVGAAIVIIIAITNTYIVSIFGLDRNTAMIVSSLLPYASIFSVYLLIVQMIGSTLAGLGRIDLCNYADTIGRLTALCVSTSLLYLQYGVVGLLIGNTVSYGVIHLLDMFILRKIIKINPFRINRFSLVRLRLLLEIGISLAGSAIISVLLSPFNKFILARYVGVSAVPLYEIAYNSAMQVRSIAEAGFRAIIPEVSSICAHRNDSAKRRVAELDRSIWKKLIKYGLPFWSLLYLLSPIMLHIWLGFKYTHDLTTVFRIMLVGSFISILGVPSFYILLGLGESKPILICNILMSIINICLVIIMIKVNISMSVAYVSISLAIGIAVSTIYLIIVKNKLLSKRTDSA
jgi:O-antigen/teichoic acid export membrane protein